ncbi:MAG: hypothetical protein VST68_02945 [Nitrospirota bacterium]|nr:hypothetical protein [Nitrospirota bacterium]
MQLPVSGRLNEAQKYAFFAGYQSSASIAMNDGLTHDENQFSSYQKALVMKFLMRRASLASPDLFFV